MADSFATCPAESLVCQCQHRVVLPTGTSLSPIGRSQSELVSYWSITIQARNLIGWIGNGAASPTSSSTSTPPVIVPCSRNLINVRLSHCLLPLEDPSFPKVGLTEANMLLFTVIRELVLSTGNVSNCVKQLINIPLNRCQLTIEIIIKVFSSQRSEETSDRKSKDCKT